MNSNTLYDNDSTYTYPCIGCKRKNCTMTATNNYCKFKTYYEFDEFKSYPARNPLKRQKNKKRQYHRGKF